MSEKLTRSERLRGDKRIEALFATGRRGVVGDVKFCWVVSEGESVSVLFSVPKKIFKKAHDRNLLKRRMRESYRTRKQVLMDTAMAKNRQIDIALICSPEVSKSWDVAVKGAQKSARPKPEIPDFKTIDYAIEKILRQILERC